MIRSFNIMWRFKMQRVNLNNYILMTFITALSPMAGIITSLLTMSSRGNNKYNYFIISLSVFMVFLYMPPMADLFRHYLTFDGYDGGGIGYFTNGAIDLLLPFVMYLFKIIGIPFYYISPLFVSFAVWFMLNAVGHITKNNDIYNRSHYLYIFTHLVAMFLMPVFIVASGLRFGLACFIVVFAVSKYSTNSIGILKYTSLIMAAALTHFSVVIFALIPILMPYVSGRRATTVILVFICASLSTIAPILILSLPFLSQEYAHAYLYGKYSSISGKNLNGTIVYILQFVPTILLFIHFIMNVDYRLIKLRKICAISSVILAISVFSSEISQRFNVIAMFVLYMHLCSILLLQNTKDISIKCTAIVIAAAIFFSFQSVYIFRKQVSLGGMYQSIYTPPLVKLMTVDNDFTSILKKIDMKTGEWIGHETASE